MAWIQSHQALERHPKTLDLASTMEWSIDETIGKLHRFWWWCVDYAEDGDLRKHINRLPLALGLVGDVGSKFLIEMKRVGFIDTQPNLRVHDWWTYHGYYLRAKYRHSSEKWERIKDLYPDSSDIDMSMSAYQTTPKLHKAKDIKKLTDIERTCRAAVLYLNEKTGRHYDPDRKITLSKISGRIKEGFTYEDCVLVIDEKVMQWGDDQKMRKFIRPETLFAPSHFEDYLQEAKERKGVKHGGKTDAGADRQDPKGDRKAKLRAAAKPLDVH